MIRFTEKHGDLELVYEGNTVQDVVELKKALNPSAIFVSKNEACCEEPSKRVDKPNSSFKP
ncbi:hypothetical protein [Brevibacillus laterosporus]|uniref:hypothetical protein n=1 Tax=Brevibacillus laterosporus TaxID=1465 RepID=UPI0018F87DB5|nr:hypothetical protein [Brevibacillus laterosporus]MBG9773561.1 hypothetical protein [Brevibacillus laterosporus]